MTAENLLVITRDLQRSCFAPTNIFAKHRCTLALKLPILELPITYYPSTSLRAMPITDKPAVAHVTETGYIFT
ncbi:MAG: hypothetical protein ACM65M_20545 [Microcoleus sp.]